MGVCITKSEFQDLASKADSLRYLQKINLPTPPTIIIPSYELGDAFPIERLGPTALYYVRFCFRKRIKRDEWRVVSSRQIKSVLAELATTVQEGDVLIQPFLSTSPSGAILKRGSVALVEAAHGLAPTLLSRGRFCYRAVLDKHNIVCTETAGQDITMIWKDTSFIETEIRGQPLTNADSLSARLIDLIADTEDILLEWGVIANEIVFFDHKHISSGFFELDGRPPRTPLSVSCTVRTVEEAPFKRVLRLKYPEIEALPSARSHDFVVVEHGALLSHLSVYSLRENYKCVFQQNH